MPMPNRNIEGNYRYKYQGQEKDPETGKEMKDEDYDDFVEGAWDEREDEFYFKTQEELIKFDFKKALKDINQKLNT